MYARRDGLASRGNGRGSGAQGSFHDVYAYGYRRRRGTGGRRAAGMGTLNGGASPGGRRPSCRRLGVGLVEL